MRPVTLPHKVIPRSFNVVQALRIHTPSSIPSGSLPSFPYHTVSPQISCPGCIPPEYSFLLFWHLLGVNFPVWFPLVWFPVKDFAPLGCLRSMGSGPGYPSARAWARECEAKRHPNAGTKRSRKKDSVFPQKSLSN